MTYARLIKELNRLSGKQLKKQIKLMEGCSGNWTTITGIEVSTEDIWRECDDPLQGDKPVVKRGAIYMFHDH